MLTGITGTRLRDRERTARQAAAGGSFALPAARDTHAGAAAGAAPADPAALLPLLALQAEDDGAARDRRTYDRAGALLKELTALQSALLAGHAEPELLARVAHLASAPNEAGDPRLAQIADWIALRANVMLARITRAWRAPLAWVDPAAIQPATLQQPAPHSGPGTGSGI